MIAAPIFLDLVQPVEGDVKGIPSGKFQDEVVAFKALHGQAPKPLVPADPMLHVDHVIPDVQIIQRGQEGRGLAFGLGTMSGNLGE